MHPTRIGQLTLVAAATDFKLLPPRDGFKHVRCPDSFRATIIQLVNAGGLALNRSYANFDEIRLRSATVRPNVNDIVQLLVGFEENTPEGNMRALERYLPNQIRRLERTIQACLDRTRETDAAFAALLDLANEVEQACHLTQGAYEELARLCCSDANVGDQVTARRELERRPTRKRIWRTRRRLPRINGSLKSSLFKTLALTPPRNVLSTTPL